MVDIVTPTLPNTADGSAQVDSNGRPISGVPGAAAKVADANTQQSMQSQKEEMHKLKINGKEREMSISELKRLASISAASDEKFKSAKTIEADANKLREAITSKNPAKIKELMLSQGYNANEVKQLLEDALLPYYQDENLTPEQRRLKELEEYKAKQDEQEGLTKKEQEELARKQEVAKFEQRLENELVNALEKADMPRNPVLAKWTAQIMHAYEQQGVTIDAEDAAQMVKKEFTKNVTDMLSGMDASKLKAFLGEGTLKKLRQDDVNSIRTTETPFAKKSVNQERKIEPMNRQTNDSEGGSRATNSRDAFLDNLRRIK